MDTLGTSILSIVQVAPSSEVEMYGQYIGRGKQFVHCREVVHSFRMSIIRGSTECETFFIASKPVSAVSICLHNCKVKWECCYLDG